MISFSLFESSPMCPGRITYYYLCFCLDSAKEIDVLFYLCLSVDKYDHPKFVPQQTIIIENSPWKQTRQQQQQKYGNRKNSQTFESRQMIQSFSSKKKRSKIMLVGGTGADRYFVEFLFEIKLQLIKQKREKKIEHSSWKYFSMCIIE